MGCITTYAANRLLDLTLRGTAFASPADVYLGWMLSPPGADGTGTEIIGGSYTREPVTFDPASGGTIEANAPAVWSPLYTAADVMLAGWGLFDAVTGGNMLAYGRVPSTVVPANRPFTMPTGWLTIDSNDAAVTQFLADAWLDHTCAVAGYTPPADPYLAAYTDTPTATTGGTEVTGGGYARIVSDWAAADDAVALLGTLAEFDPLHTSTDQDITGIAVTDAASAGNVLLFGSYPTPVTVPAGDNLRIPANSVGFRIL